MFLEKVDESPNQRKEATNESNLAIVYAPYKSPACTAIYSRESKEIKQPPKVVLATSGAHSEYMLPLMPNFKEGME